MGVLKLLSLATALFAPAVVSISKDVAPKVPGAYIVELADSVETDSFYSKLGSAGHAAEHRMDFKYSLFNGLSFRLKNATDEAAADAAAEQIAQMPMVRKLWPVRVYKVPNDELIWTANEKTAPPVAALQKRQETANDTFSPHVMTQVDLLNAQGFRGAGIRIAVIDTGVDYLHPALGGCFGEGCLVSFGTDLAGNEYTGYNTPVPDPDPYDCEGHGTHVSGIIAAQNNPFGFTGAAPDVTLGAYRVFGCTGETSNEVLIAAYNQAYEAGADIITASIGGVSGWSEDSWAVAVQRIVEAGVPCTVSAGNSGDEGQFYSSTAANGIRVTGVASVDNTESPAVLRNASYTVNNSTSTTFGWIEGYPSNWGNFSLPLWSVNFNTSDTVNACDPLPDDTPDLSGYIVLIRRGTCTFVQKVTNVANKGARYVMFYNNIGGASSVAAEVPGIEAIGMTTPLQGAEWIRLLSNGSSVVLNIVDPNVATQFVVSEPNTVTGGFLSTFTSWGPNWELEVKPQISSPGGSILSTYPLDLGGYAVYSGTSMACPLAAAVFALVSEVRGTLDPATLENAIAATSNPNLFNDGASTYPFLAPVSQQGAGLIQAFDAAYATVIPSVSSIGLNDSFNRPEAVNFTLLNAGDEDVTFAISNVPAETAYTLATGDIYPMLFPNEFAASYATLDIAKEVTVPTGGETVVTLSVTEPEGLDVARLPVFSGYIAMNGSDGSSLSLPYLGVAGSMNAATVLDSENSYVTSSDDFNYFPVPANTTFTLPAGNSTNDTVAYPSIAVSLALGSPLVRVDVHPYGGHSNATEILGVQTLGNIFGFPETYLPRGATVSTWNGLLEDGTRAPAGTYQLVVSTMHIFGDAENVEDYDRVVSVPFSIRYA